MALTISKTEGSTVITLTSDPQSVCPPLYQILKNLCCSPICCSVSQHLRRLQNTSQTVLGTLQIMVGLLNIGIGAIFAFPPIWDMSEFYFWLGALFMLFGIVSILSEKYPSPCLVIVNVILNLAGVGFAITAITLYSLRMTHMWVYWLCKDNNNRYYYHHSPSSSGEKRMEQKCLRVKDMMLMLLRSMHGLMIVLSTLELCLTISSAVLGIKALRRRGKDEKMSTGAGRMALTISKTESSTVITLTSDPQSVCPPLYQILKNLCCSPICCSVSQHLRRLQNTSQTVLGTLQIMVGLLNIGIGAIFAFTPIWDIFGFSFWVGALFMLFGIVSILSEKYPSPCLVIVNMILNFAGVGFAIAAILLYDLRMTYMGLYWLCEDDNNQNYYHLSPTASSGDERWEQKCLETKDMMLMLLRSMHGLLIVLSALELCLNISSVGLGIKALMRRGKDVKMNEEPEYYKPLLDEVPGNPEV
ncbi:uncharacterized protein LOC117500498 [Trematomus bernacchii]|uniref:uncharacterized protein LOC117500498 n=1 Tax=Trematomus bernacchii TaxID=40690 RepID=UPI00146B49BE|nr:uncharacterized protein LOC117500498 [Trematomus bernacchii]